MLPHRLLTILLLVLSSPSHFVTMAASYSIGTPGTPWGTTEKAQWRDSREIQRSYLKEVVTKIDGFKQSDVCEVIHYGALSQDVDKYPLYVIKTRNWDKDKPYVLITGGVHGYETSGVQGALLFLEQKAKHYSQHFNILVAPCVSPWGYETIQRWNAQAVDPNRSFNPDGEVVEGRSFNPEAATEESSALIQLLKEQQIEQWTCHIDLHETTDTDETEFRPAKAARDGITGSKPGEIPDGFYLVQDITSPTPDWFTAMIESVRKVTHIAPTDKDGKLIGEEVTQEGVIGIPSKKSLGLCAGVTNSPYRTTTEVYPDSPQATPDQCNEAQVACIVGALDHIISELAKECDAA